MPAQERLAVDLGDLSYGDVRFTVVHNVDAEPNNDSAKVADALTRQVSSPVKWLQSVQKLRELGVDKFVEVGPGKVLTGLLRQIDRDATGMNVEDSASLRSTLETL